MRRSERRLRGLLEAADVDTSSWGSPGTKTVEECAEETEQETWVYLRDHPDGSGRRQVVRFARRALVYVRYFHPERKVWYRLRESMRVHRGGYRIDTRDLRPIDGFPEASFSETCLLGEPPIRTARRGAKEEPKFRQPPLKLFTLLHTFPVDEHDSEAFLGIVSANRKYAIQFLARDKDYANGRVRIEKAKGIATIFDWCEEEPDFKTFYPLAA